MTTEPQKQARPEVAAGMAAARERGVHVGRPKVDVPPAASRADELRGTGKSLAQIAAALEAEGVPTVSGTGSWSKRGVQYVLGKLDAHRAAESSRSAAPPADPGA